MPQMPFLCRYDSVGLIDSPSSPVWQGPRPHSGHADGGSDHILVGLPARGHLQRTCTSLIHPTKESETRLFHQHYIDISHMFREAYCIINWTETTHSTGRKEIISLEGCYGDNSLEAIHWKGAMEARAARCAVWLGGDSSMEILSVRPPFTQCCN